MYAKAEEEREEEQEEEQQEELAKKPESPCGVFRSAADGQTEPPFGTTRIIRSHVSLSYAKMNRKGTKKKGLKELEPDRVYSLASQAMSV